MPDHAAADDEHWHDLIRKEHQEHDRLVRALVGHHNSEDPSDPETWERAVYRAAKAGDLEPDPGERLEDFLWPLVQTLLQQLIAPGLILPPHDFLSALLLAAELGHDAAG